MGGYSPAGTREDAERAGRAACLRDVPVGRMSFGAGVVLAAVKDGATEGPRGRGPWARSEAAEGSPPDGGRGYRRVERVSVAPSGTQPSVAPAANRTAFYALRPGGVRDYWTLLHPPYTVWHLSYVLLGAALAPMPDPRIVAGALLAFFLAVGVAAHSFDELRGRPLGTRIPDTVLIALGALGLVRPCALG